MDPCEVVLPLALERCRGEASGLAAQVRLGMYDNAVRDSIQELSGVTVTATWVPPESVSRGRSRGVEGRGLARGRMPARREPAALEGR